MAHSTNWKLKLKAILHDPPYKLLAFSRRERGKSAKKEYGKHELWAEELYNYIFPNERIKDDMVEEADRLASAQSRILVKPSFEDKNEEKEFKKRMFIDFEKSYFIDIFSKKKGKTEYPEPEDVKKLFGKLKELSKSFSDEDKAKFCFLFLWRFLPKIFPQIEKHPADSRAPNHSIYDHLVQTSSIVSALPKPAFLLFTISPVKDFIEKSRKTQDLWAGSYLISYLMWKSMKPVVEELGPDAVIFPNLLEQPLIDRWLSSLEFNSRSFYKLAKELGIDWGIDSEEFKERLIIASLPNRFLAVIPYESNYGQRCEEEFKRALKNLAEGVWEGIKKHDRHKETREKMIRQILSYFKAFWVVLPWIGERNNYSPNDALNDYRELLYQNEAYKTVEKILKNPLYKNINVGSAYHLLIELTERLLTIRKNIRDFEFLEQEGEKCHLCGEFEVLKVDWKGLKPNVVKEKEKLCGLCLIKRLFPKIFKGEFNVEVAFPSTAEMASVGEKRRLKDEIKGKLESRIRGKFKNRLPKSVSVPNLKKDKLFGIDGQFLMEENYRTNYLRREFGIEVSEEELKDMLEILKGEGVEPSRYYGLLLMDGDRMKGWLRGEFNPTVGEVIHEDVKSKLEGYRKIGELLKLKHPMSPSLHQAFSRRLSKFALQDIRSVVEKEHYGKLVYAGGDSLLALLPIEELLTCSLSLRERFREGLSERATISAGILVTHYKYPLYLALKEVREALKRAKTYYGRDSFCLKFLRRNGEKRECGGKWEYAEFIRDLKEKFKGEVISGRLPYQYLQAVRGLGDEKEVLERELRRIFLRKVKGDLGKYLEEKLIPRLREMELENFANTIIIAFSLAKEVRL